MDTIIGAFERFSTILDHGASHRVWIKVQDAISELGMPPQPISDESVADFVTTYMLVDEEDGSLELTRSTLARGRDQYILQRYEGGLIVDRREWSFTAPD